MSSGVLIALEMLLVLGLVVGFGCYELWTLRRDRLRRDAERARESAPSARDDPHGPAGR